MKSTPIIINNFNRLTSTRNMVEFLHKRGYNSITILDNQSTYPPLLEWYNNLRTVRVIRLEKNYGAHAFFWTAYSRMISAEHFVLSDSDIELNENMPDNFLEVMKAEMEAYNQVKIGVALRIDDFPEGVYGHAYIPHESLFWRDKKPNDVYGAMVDTTFCLLKKTDTHDLTALRIAGNFTARHLPWYVDFNNLSEEEAYFIEHSNYDSTYKKDYDSWKSTQHSKKIYT